MVWVNPNPILSLSLSLRLETRAPAPLQSHLDLPIRLAGLTHLQTWAYGDLNYILRSYILSSHSLRLKAHAPAPLQHHLDISLRLYVHVNYVQMRACWYK